MTFLSPIYLWLLPLAALPLIIHFIFIRTRKTIVFPSNILLKTVIAKRGAFYRFRDAFLMLIRTTMIALIVFLFAMPFITNAERGARNVDATFVIVDTSPSMGRMVEGESLLAGGVRALLRFAQERFLRRPHAPFVFIFQNADPLSAKNFNETREIANTISLEDAPFSFARAMRAARMYAERMQFASYALFLLSDLSADGFSNALPVTHETYLLPEPPPSENDMGIRTAAFENALFFQGQTKPLSVTLFEGAKRTTRIRVYEGETPVAVAEIERGKTNIAVPVTLRGKGRVPLTAELDDDDYPANNRYFIPVAVERALSIQLIGSRETPFGERNALELAALALSPDVATRNEGAFYSFSFRQTPSYSAGDAAIVAERAFTAETARRVRALVENGIDTLVFFSKDDSAMALRSALIREGFIRLARVAYAASDAPLRIVAQREEEVYAPFLLGAPFAAEGFVRAYFSFGDLDAPNATKPVRLENGDPLLVRVPSATTNASAYFFLAPITRENVSLYASPMFVTLMHRIMFDMRRSKLRVGSVSVGDVLGMVEDAAFLDGEAGAHSATRKGFYLGDRALIAANIGETEHSAVRIAVKEIFPHALQLEGEGETKTRRGGNLAWALLAVLILLFAFETALSFGLRARFPSIAPWNRS